jgi:hypothetical protein
LTRDILVVGIKTNRKNPIDRCSLASNGKWMRRAWPNPRENKTASRRRVTLLEMLP